MTTSTLLCRTLVCAGACAAAVLAAAPARADEDHDRVPHYDKVVLVIEENQQFSTIIGNSAAPYTNWLANHGALLTRSYGTEHPSEPNYLDLFSGSDQNVYDDGLPPSLPFAGPNLGAALLHRGLSFAGFSEDQPAVGDTTTVFAADPSDPPGTHDYARKHNPWANWQNDAFPASVLNQGSNYLPSSANQTFAPFAAISASHDFDDLPTVSIVVPNQQHDDHGVAGGLTGNALIAAGDSWLQANLSAYADWAKHHNSLLIVTWDEDDYTSINRVPTIFYGAHVRTGQYSEAHLRSFTSVINADGQPSGAPVYAPVQGINHWNVLRTIEEIYGLPHLGQSFQTSPITDIFER